MHRRNNAIYVPTLRMKKGELEGLLLLRSDVADCVLPLLIVPPAKERDSASQESLFPEGKDVPDVGGIVSRFWAHRQAFVDANALFKEYGMEQAVDWLPALYARARSMGVFAIPTASLVTLEQMGLAAFKNSILAHAELKFGLRIESGELADPSISERVGAVLTGLGLTAAECTVFADFSSGADLSDPQIVEPIIRGALEQLQTFGQWQLICFLGTHYPETNPAKPGQTATQPRNEWLAWKAAVKFDPSTAQHMIFGDFAADSAKMDFKAGRAQPIRHIRYATASDWLVVRGVAEGTDYESMKDVFQRIVDSGEFSGATFSEADLYIYDVARNNSPRAGNATTWRQVNTTHHITQVVADIAAVRRIPISKLPNEPAGTQQSLLVV